MILVPGLGYTIDGKRLGRGKGFYDEYIHRMRNLRPHCFTIGLAFSCQILSHLPLDSTDEILDQVIFAD